MLSSTYFEQPSVHPQEDLFDQIHPDIGQTAYKDL